jgi:hypothetical protein
LQNELWHQSTVSKEVRKKKGEMLVSKFKDEGTRKRRIYLSKITASSTGQIKETVSVGCEFLTK